MAVTVALRPEKIRLTREAPPEVEFNAVQGTIKEMSYFGSFTVYHLELRQRRAAQGQPGQHAAPPRRRTDLGRRGLGALVARRPTWC